MCIINQIPRLPEFRLRRNIRYSEYKRIRKKCDLDTQLALKRRNNDEE